MSFEIEVKYRSVDHARLVQLLEEMGAEPKSDDEQEDSYLNHPARDFAQSHEAFRIRRVGSRNRITYKGPRQPGPTKTREEIEIGFSDGPHAFQELAKLFGYLGFRRVATVTKRRRSFRLIHDGIEIEIGLDHVERLGDFAEVEAIAPGDAEVPAAQGAILDLAARLGLSEVEPRSYLRMVLERVERESPESP
jgi:adenylate cyclase class 2